MNGRTILNEIPVIAVVIDLIRKYLEHFTKCWGSSKDMQDNVNIPYCHVLFCSLVVLIAALCVGYRCFHFPDEECEVLDNKEKLPNDHKVIS